ncbi:MAG: hypothetical protein O0V67_00335, partial [Methanocorpusculum sp.]|nr:hypothetical protein [Methanocorpusculum sp.]
MSTTIESLELQVQSSATSAVGGIDALASSLGKLKNATKGGVGLTAVAKQLTTLNSALNGVSGANADNLNKLAQGLQTLSSCGNLKLSSSVAAQITNIGNAVKSLNGSNFSVLSDLANALAPLSSVGKANLNSFISQLNRLPQAIQSLNSVDTGSLRMRLQELTSAFEPMTQMGKNNLTSFVTQLKKLPEAVTALQSVNIGQLASQIQQLADAFKPLATEMQSIANGFSALPTRLQRLIQQTNNLSNSNNKAANSYVNFAAKIGIAVVALKRIASVVASWIVQSNKYVEDLNLFTAAMGDYADEAKRYAENVAEIMGIDPAEWLRNQGIFMTITKGFGVMSERAYIMSKNLTQLGYDISSFYNISFQDAMQKLSSGISGELEPLRRLGYDLSVARLQQEAYTLGITKSVNAMTQAEKAELRYYAIMTQVTTAQGDMARTLTAPANQIRILQAQVTQCARALGNIFIPALNAVLPYAIALAKVIRILANAIASLFGFALPEIDYSGVGGGLSGIGAGAEEAADGMGGAAKKAKELKNALLGIDELNVISEPDASGGGAGDIGGGGGGLGFELPQYDFLGDAINNKVNQILENLQPAINWVKEHLDDILDVVLAIGAGFLAWKISTALLGGVGSIQEWFKNNKVAVGVTLMVTGFTLAALGAYDIGYEGPSWENILKTVIGDALLIGGSLITFGTGPVGWIVGGALALTVTIVGIAIGANKRKLKEDLESRFGDWDLSQEELQSWVNELTHTELGLKIDLYVSEESTLDSIKEQVSSAIKKLNSNNFKIQCGIEISESDYQASIDAFLESAKEYLQQKQVVSALAVDIAFDESATGIRLSEFVSSYYSTAYTQLDELGSELKDVVSSGFVDGEWIPDKMAEALELQKEIQEILDYISTVEFEAKLTALKLDASDTDLSAESFTELLKNAQDTIQGKVESLEGIRLEALKVAKMEFDQNILNGMSDEAAQQIYDSAVAEAEQAFRDGKLELSFGTYDFGMDVILSRYADEVEKTVPFFEQTTQDLFMQGTMCLLPDETYDNVDNLFMQLHDAFLFGLQDLDISNEARTNIGELLKSLEPTKAQYTELADSYTKAGQSVPESISEGLHDYYLLSAISGDMKSINYLIGEYLSEDQSFLKMLETAEDAGLSVGDAVAEGLRNSVEFVEDESTNTVRVVKDGITLATLQATPTLVRNMEQLGVDLSLGVTDGMEDGLDENECVSIWSRIKTWFCNLFGIHSPSTVFIGYGQDVVSGFMQGMDDYRETKSAVTGWGTSVRDWFTNGSFGGVNSLSFSTFANNIIEGFRSKLGLSHVNTKTNVTTWASNVKNWFTSNSFGGVNSESFASFANSTIEGFRNKISSAYTNTKSSITTWASNVKNWFNGTSFGSVNSTTFSTYATNVIDGFKNRVSGYYTSAQSAMSTFASNVKSWFTNTVSYNSFYNIAADVIEGFKNGIGNLYHTVKNTISSWGSSIISWFKERLQSNSPSKVFERIGEDTVLGYNIGLASLGKTTRGVVSDWANSFTSVSPVMSFAVDTSAL